MFRSIFGFSSILKNISFNIHTSDVAYLIERARSSITKKMSGKLTVEKKKIKNNYLVKILIISENYHLKFHFG